MWTTTYNNELRGRFTAITAEIPGRLAQITAARTAPSLDDLPIGSAKKLDAAVMFFDIEGFTARTASDDNATLTGTLHMLNCVIPMMMHVIHDHGGYVEKNTGDGVMAIFYEGTPQEIVHAALDSAVTCMYVLREFVNPYLARVGVAPVRARIGIDHGNLLLSKIGVPTGTAEHRRNFLTAVGPTANIAFRLQAAAGTDQILVGHFVYEYASDFRRAFSMQEATPAEWIWVHGLQRERYLAWRFTETRSAPFDWSAALAALRRQ